MAQFPEVGVKLVADGAGKFIADLKQTGAVADSLGDAIKDAGTAMTGLAQDAGKAETSTAQLGQAMRDVAGDAGKLDSGLDGAEGATKELGKAAIDTSAKVGTLATDLDKASGAAGGLGTSAQGASGHLGGFADSLGNVGSMLAGAATVGALALGAAIVGVGASAFNTANDINDATTKISAQLGLSADQAGAYGDSIRNVYGANFGDSIEDVGNALVAVDLQMARLEGTTQETLEAATVNAFRLRDAFGVDVTEATQAAATLMSEFGISQEEAFDFITAGFQNGMNASDDFLDSIGEYSTQFAEGGADAGQFFSLMETGLGGGMLGTDKAADMFKEFRLRILDGSDATRDATASLFGFEGGVMDTSGQMSALNGDMLQNQVRLDALIKKQANYSDSVSDSQKALDSLKIQELTAEITAQEAAMGRLGEQNGQYVEGVEGMIDFEGGVTGFFAALSDGSLSSADAFQIVLDGLSGIEDPAERMQTAVALMGTQFEDLGDSAALGIDMTTTSMEDMAGATKKLDAQYNTFGDIASGAFRRVQLALEPFGQLMDKLAVMTLPFFEQAIVGIETALGTAAEVMGSFMSALEEGMSPLDAFIEAIWEIAPQPVLDALVYLRDDIIPPLIAAFDTFIQPIMDAVAQFVQWEDVLVAAGIVLGIVLLPIMAAAAASLAAIVVAVAPLIAAFVAVIAIVALLRTAWENDWGGIQGKTAAVWAFVQDVFSQFAKWVTGTLIPRLQALYDKWVRDVWPEIQKATEIAWAIVSDIFAQLVAWVTDTLIPTVQALYDKWVTEVWPAIQTVTENVWTIISTIFAEIGRWINDNIIPWVAELSRVWGEKWTEIKEFLAEAWAIIEPILASMKEWFTTKMQEGLAAFGAKWSEVMGGLEAPINAIKGVWDGFVKAVQDFWAWISSTTFTFNFSIPNLPNLPPVGGGGTPPPGVTPPTPQGARDMMIAPSSGVSSAAYAPPSTAAQIVNNINNQTNVVNFTGNYSSSPEVTDKSSLVAIMAGYA